ncbi:MAG TPA: ParB/RepB/Spo0J family partition protein, partial [Methanomassiliicoccales archaeon]|nr:ParB/RepB/Spo0J family partition protein [Methanomassiliicoccales archaeon]
GPGEVSAVVYRSLTHTIMGRQFKDKESALTEFWRYMAAHPGSRKGSPKDYITIDEDRIGFDPQSGWEIPYVAEIKDEAVRTAQEKVVAAAPNPNRDDCVNCQNVLKTANLAVEAKIQTAAPNPFVQLKEGERMLPVDSILITGHNPRKLFDLDALKALAEDIDRNGLINPVLVRPKGNLRYEIVAGERRLRAFRLLKRVMIPAKVRELTDDQVLDIMMSENLHRVDLNPIEEAHHLKRILEVGKITQTELGRRMGKTQEWVSLRIRLAGAPSDLQDLIISRLISPSAAMELLADKNADQLDNILELVKQEVRDLDEGEDIPRDRVRDCIRAVMDPVMPFVSSVPTTMPAASEVDEEEPEGNDCFGEPGAAGEECAVDCPQYEDCKAEGQFQEDDEADDDQPAHGGGHDPSVNGYDAPPEATIPDDAEGEPEPTKVGQESEIKMARCFLDGNALCIVWDDFVNIQESEAVFVELNKAELKDVRSFFIGVAL